MSARKPLHRVVAVATVVGLGTMLAGCGDSSTTVVTPINYSCQVDPHQFPLPTQTGSFAGTYDTTAVQAVAPAGNADVKVGMEPFSVDGTPTANGTLTQISDVVTKFVVPSGATITAQTFTGGTNIGPGTPTISTSGNVATLTVPGPIPSSTQITLPIVTLTLDATGALGSTIDTKIAGTSFSSPGLTFNARITGTPVGTLNPSFACFPSPSPSLHGILISNDVNPPTITITAPVANQNVTTGSTVLADYSCDDGSGGTGVQSCTGTVADGAPIDTSTLGAHTFTVTAKDNQGLTSTANVTYTVVAA